MGVTPFDRSLVPTLLADVLGQAYAKAGRRNKECGLGGPGVGGLTVIDVLEALGNEEVIGLVEVANVHAHRRHVPIQRFYPRDVHIRATLFKR